MKSNNLNNMLRKFNEMLKSTKSCIKIRQSSPKIPIKYRNEIIFEIKIVNNLFNIMLLDIVYKILYSVQKRIQMYKKMTLDEIKKYERYIRYLAGRKASRYVEVDDLISAVHERLIKVKIKKENAYKHYIAGIIRHAILRECKKQLPNPYRGNYKKQYPLMPEHQEFIESDTPPEGIPDNNINRIYFQEKLQEIMRVATRQEKRYIRLFLQDLNPLGISKKMKIDHRYISEIVKKIRNKIGKNA